MNQARRHVIKSGPAEVRASVEGTSGGEHEWGYPPLARGDFFIYGCLYVRFYCILGAFWPEFQPS